MPARRTKLESSALAKAKAVFRKYGGIMRMANAVQAGIHRNTLYAMRDAGVIEQLSRGLYPPCGCAAASESGSSHRSPPSATRSCLPDLGARPARPDHTDSPRGLAGGSSRHRTSASRLPSYPSIPIRRPAFSSGYRDTRR